MTATQQFVCLGVTETDLESLANILTNFDAEIGKLAPLPEVIAAMLRVSGVDRDGLALKLIVAGYPPRLVSDALQQAQIYELSPNGRYELCRPFWARGSTWLGILATLGLGTGGYLLGRYVVRS